MSNKKRIKEMKDKISKLDNLSKEECKNYLKNEIKGLKNLRIKTIQEEINEGINDLELLKIIKSKLDSGKKLSKTELLFFTLNF